MPIYEFECKSCGTVQEVMQKMSDPPPEACGSCEKGPLVKLMSRTAFVLKGAGWYVTDFRDKGKKPEAKPAAKDESSSSSSSSAAETSDTTGTKDKAPEKAKTVDASTSKSNSPVTSGH